MKAKCKNCQILERKILMLAKKYDDLLFMASRGKNIADVGRGIAENKIMEAFRKNEVFSSMQVEPEESYAFITGGISQSVNLKRAIEVLQKLQQQSF